VEFKELGKSGHKIPMLGLGTWEIGGGFSPSTSGDAESVHALQLGIELGMRFIDTAEMYGHGHSEEIVAKAGKPQRDNVFIASKVSREHLHYDDVIRACESSLKRLETDYIDLYQMHHVDRETPWEEIWQAMEVLVQQGKVIYVGSSNFAAWDIAQANSMAKARNFLGLVSEQSLYNLSARMIELEVIPACRAFGLGIIPWSPLAGGMLGGALQKAKEGRRAEERRQKDIEKCRPQLEAWEKFCGELGEQPADVALAWLLANPDVTGPIIGPRTMDQLAGALQALEIKLDEGAMKKLDEIWPGPGGEAPKAYAW